MAVLKVRTSKAKINRIIDYVSNKEKTEEKLISGHNCTPENAKEEFATTKEIYKKTGGIQYHHYMQSFLPGEVTPEQAHQLGQELAEKIGGDKFECYIATHVDKEHIHNHIVVNSVSFEDGKKFHSNKADLKQLKEFTNKQAEREGLSKMDFDKSAERISSEELRLRLKGGESWKEDLRQVIKYSKEKTNSIEEMKQYLKDNFNVETKIQNINIKYKHPEKENFTGGKKLGDDFNKQELEKFFNEKLKEKILADENERIENVRSEELKTTDISRQEESKRLEELTKAEQEESNKAEERAREARQLKEEARKLAEQIYQDKRAQEALRALDEYIRQEELKRIEESEKQNTERQKENNPDIDNSKPFQIDNSIKEKWWQQYEVPKEYMQNLMETETDPIRFNQKLMAATDLLIEWRKRDMEMEKEIEKRFENKDTEGHDLSTFDENSVKGRLARINEQKIQKEVERRVEASGVTGQGEGRNEQQRNKDSGGAEIKHTTPGNKEDERSQQKGVGELTFERKLNGVNEVLRDIERRAGRKPEQDKPDINRDSGKNKEPERKQPDINRDDKQRGRSFER